MTSSSKCRDTRTRAFLEVFHIGKLCHALCCFDGSVITSQEWDRVQREAEAHRCPRALTCLSSRTASGITAICTTSMNATTRSDLGRRGCVHFRVSAWQSVPNTVCSQSSSQTRKVSEVVQAKSAEEARLVMAAKSQFLEARSVLCLCCGV